MKKITKIFFIVLILSIIGCHTPPSRESQDKDFFSFDQVINTSDRILKLSRNGNQISFIVDDISYTSFQFKVLKKIKGSSKKDDLIYITFTNEHLHDLNNFNVNESMIDDLFNDGDYFFFLMGRARKNTFPKELGGSLWLINGNPSIYHISNNRINIFSSKELDQTILNNFSKLINMDENSFIELIESIDE
ncbi:MAG: hypothetical protein FI678_03725 [SAR202 cluster bacterium]|nr:hypothetical protein [SAR202 cluster bacterium]MQG43534.1 hypothetical protein [SAR202 cluster bacterium]|tara:strand:- start:1363 stop:1935 length:573 start_codon:yes stop_codon:yes gene_type:complete